MEETQPFVITKIKTGQTKIKIGHGGIFLGLVNPSGIRCENHTDGSLSKCSLQIKCCSL